MQFIFWHHAVHGPVSLTEIWSGLHGYGGSVARLRLLFWIAERGHDVQLIGNVEPGKFRGVTASSGIDWLKSDARRDLAEPSILVLNDAPSDENWQKVAHLPNLLRLYWAGVPFPFKWLERIKEGSLHRIVCVSRFHRDLYRIYRGFEHIEYSYSGVDLDLLKQATPSVLPEYTVLSVSIPRRTKGFHNLLEAWKYVHTALPGARLRVCGAAKMHDPNARVGLTDVLDAEIESAFPDFFSNPPATCHQYGIDLMGTRSLDSVYSDLKAANVAVVNANWDGSVETYCRSAVEAQAAGTPVVGAKRGSLPEVVQDGVTGLLIDRPSPVMLGEAIVKLLSDDKLRQRMGSDAKKWAQPKADYALLAQDWEAIAQRAQSGKPAPSERHQVSDWLRRLGYGQVRLWAKKRIEQLRTTCPSWMA